MALYSGISVRISQGLECAHIFHAGCIEEYMRVAGRVVLGYGMPVQMPHSWHPDVHVSAQDSDSDL